MKLKLVTFDLDGTLYRNGIYNGRLVRQWLLKGIRTPCRTFRGVRAARAFLKARSRIRKEGPREDLHREQFELAAESCGYDVSFVRQVLYELIYDNPFEDMVPYLFPGVEVALLALKGRGLKLGVLSDYPVETKIRSLGLEKIQWDLLMSSEDANALKPHPAPFLMACRRMSVEPSEAIHVGDRTDCDVAGAKAAGMKTLLFKGEGDRGLPGPMADFEATDFGGVRVIIETLLG